MYLVSRTSMSSVQTWLKAVYYLLWGVWLVMICYDYDELVGYNSNFKQERWSVGVKQVLVTGGAGYIGSHTVLLLLDAGYEVTVVDNLVNANPESLNRVANNLTTGVTADVARRRLHFFQIDLRDRKRLSALLDAMTGSGQRPVHACIHFAGLKAVGESTKEPLMYFDNNVGGTVVLLEEMKHFNIKRIIFSSSATVYGRADLPITEQSPTGAGITNAYGRTKYVIEEILGDLSRSPSGQDWSVVILRYFNPVGAHPSGLIGEDPSGKPNNLMPFVAQTAIGRRSYLSVFGDDYDTPDGTGVRDYIHVMDLAEGHIAALNFIEKVEQEWSSETPATPVVGKDGRNSTGSGLRVFNLGTGRGYSVLEMVAAMKSSCECDIPYRVEPRRPGDLATVYAATEKARDILDWKAKRDLRTMCDDLWHWQRLNPRGYPAESHFFRETSNFAWPKFFLP